MAQNNSTNIPTIANANLPPIVNNRNWDILPKWIQVSDNHYQFLQKELIDRVFPILEQSDKQLLLDSIVLVINMIYLKFGFTSVNTTNSIGSAGKPADLLWKQLTQNRLLDLRAILNAMLPYINDNATDDKKHRLRKLEDLYLEKDTRDQYVYTNMQYNRCIRKLDTNGTIETFDRPFIRDYFIDHLELLLMSIETVSNKLYVNWVDILPMKMSEYTNTKLFTDTVNKLNLVYQTVDLINGYIDPSLGLSFQDIYNTMSNHLFHEIKNHKWLIYDIIVTGSEKPTSYFRYLENRFDFTPILDGKLWSQMSIAEINRFQNQWNNFLNSTNINDNTVLHHFYFFFSKYHRNSQKLIRQSKLILNKDPDQEEDVEENIRITPETTRDARRGMNLVPTDEIYLFLEDQLTAFKKSWYYYMIKINNQQYLVTEGRISITPKNIYNYCKSLVHYTLDNNFIQIPNLWSSLKPELIELMLIRILDIPDTIRNDWNRPRGNWFNINNYIRQFYKVPEADLPNWNKQLHVLIRSKLPNIIFESMIYHGLLVDFRPNSSITDNNLVESTIGTTDDVKKTEYKRKQLAKQYFTGHNRTDYENQSYYFITGQTYGQLKPIRVKTYKNYSKTYFDFLATEQIWTFTYAMNWVSQINFNHHYLNDRVMYITGATGVGKSTQVPKLLMYSQVMLDYNSSGKIICTQPRVPPTVKNADTIATELGVPIRAYDELYDKYIFTPNYYIQYKHQKEEHIDRSKDSFLRIVTDGTLLEEIIGSPFLTRTVEDPFAIGTNGQQIDWAKIYTTGNIYDIVIVDEAHEHNANMDMILTLARDAIYVNNSTKLVIVSATMDDDEPIYRRYYRRINDNRAYPLSAFIEKNNLDRANMDRRIHISPPGATTQYIIHDHYLTDAESDLITDKNFLDYGIKKTIDIVNSTTTGDILLFMTGQADIHKSIKRINEATPPNVVALGYYSELSEDAKEFIVDIHRYLPSYTRYKDDVELPESEITRSLPKGTYTRAVIIATNVAEASITLRNLKYVVDTGYAKVVVFDPITGMKNTLTLPISFSSAMQRRGRVGRVSSGDFYPLYSLNKVINNKTAYKIADSDIKDLVVKLLKSQPNDPFIITRTNDINQLNNIVTIIEKRNTGAFVAEDLVYDVLNNPRPYLDIINKQYLYIADLTDINQYYTYYGQANLNQLFIPNKTNPLDYFQQNHDDYDFQLEHQNYYSRCYTGYDNYILEDQSLTFYIIHPDENIIQRNLYTGQMIAIKVSDSVSDSYYYYLLKINHINNVRSINKSNIRNIQLIKYPLAIADAKLQMLVVDIPVTKSQQAIRYTNVTDSNTREYIKEYFEKIPNVNYDNITTVKSQMIANLYSIRSTVSLNILNDTNNLLWYCYSIPNDVHTDVLAIMTMIDTVP